tara:strand:+ start:37 stop:543 length:507 start_codon:yes stop_codon:yes gene_type:complete
LKPEALIKKNKYYNLEISSIGVEDINQCLEIDQLIFRGLWTKTQWTKELAERDRICYGIYSESKIIAIACGWIVVDELQITAIGVHPLKRNCGLGEKILSYLLNQAKMKGVTKAILEVKSYNLPAKNLYIKMGFTYKAIRKNFYEDGSDALIFDSDLNAKGIAKNQIK